MSGYQVREKRYGRSGLVYYEDRPFPWQYISLSRTNYQIPAEVHKAVTVVQNAGNLIYRADIMIDGLDIYVTWLSALVPTKHLAELQVDFRRVNEAISQWFGDGGPGRMVCVLGELLSRFLAYGPAFFGEPGSESEWLFDVLSLRLLDGGILERLWASETLEDDFGGLEACAALLAN